MNKLFLLVGLLSAGVAMGQTKAKTTKMSSTTTSTSNYNNSNTSNYNSQDATSGRNSSTDASSATTGNPSSMNGTGSGSSTTQSTTSTDTRSTTQPNGLDNSSTTDGSMGTTGNTTNGTYNNSTSMTPSGTNNYNTTTGANGATTTSPTTTGGNDNNVGTTSNTTYSTTTTDAYPKEKKDYKNFAYGIYAGVNSTSFKGESFDKNGSAPGVTGRLGYQLGFFVRGGGRLYGQIGAEYFASSSNYFTAGTTTGTTPVANISDRIDIKYIQVPVYVGYKLTQSERGISSVRVQVGVEYANQIGSTANQFGNLNNFQLNNGTFNGLGQLGFDAGPIYLDLTYHYGFSNAIQQNTGFASSQRRILSASVGFKF